MIGIELNSESEIACSMCAKSVLSANLGSFIFMVLSFAMKSLARKLKVEISPNAVYVHCFAHCNKLIVKDAIDQYVFVVIDVIRFMPIPVCDRGCLPEAHSFV